jgi:D-hexose-6-phosphate mutarotase
MHVHALRLCSSVVNNPWHVRRQANSQNLGLSSYLCMAPACMGHVAVGQASLTVVKDMVSLSQDNHYASVVYQSTCTSAPL